MVKAYPFQAVMPIPEKARDVASPPYDVVTYREARDMVVDNPCSFLRVLRSEIDLPEDNDPYAPEVYERARDNYENLKKQGLLVKDQEPSLYVYSLCMNEHRQTGLALLCSADDYQREAIRKHEKTRPDKETDRTNHILTLQAHTGLVFLTCPDNQRLQELLQEVTQQRPLIDFIAPDSVQHTLWRAAHHTRDQLLMTVEDVPVLYIADGHHRAAAAARAGAKIAESQERQADIRESDLFPAVVFPASQLSILPYNRVVKDLAGRTPAGFLEELSTSFEIEPTQETAPEQTGHIHLYLDGRWHRLILRDNLKPSDETSTPVDKLDVSLLQNYILSPVLNIDNPRTDQRIDFVGGIRGTEELISRVDSGEAAAAFSLYPTTVNQLMEIAAAKQEMPPKSTWFEPKLRDGLLVHELK